jgi:hypothetical protein
MFKEYLTFLILYKTQILYLFVFSSGVFLSSLMTPECTRKEICGDDTATKEKVIKMNSKLNKNCLDRIRAKEDFYKKECDVKIIEALKNKKSNTSKLDCLICKSLMNQCELK